ncbi:double-strand break repair helicase AddA [uncultured Tateyamaria sp.]|uniref:double-strand break repair helicase AddA n=1 Tax=uncultured Tateyamaria sp. TaxID=455651 RepID=UPI0026061264|nr:double-strand break repair helicase AddA [uncultured Tateyamaria sp.]
MTPLNEATRRQHSAAEPMASTWLSANAGSGKTRVLTDRVARLLLEEVEPQHILCLTYTKAAASEMQNRLFQRLGAWAMLDDADLRGSLAELGLDRAPQDDDLRRARTLFARAIETPGGLKIQTIHSFCASLLRRFPLEAGVSPQFTEIEDRAADLLRAELVDQMADGPDADCLAALARHYTGEDFLKLTKTMVGMSDDFTDLTMGDALALFDQLASLTHTSIESATFAPSDWELLQDLIPALVARGGNDGKAAAKLSTLNELNCATLPDLMDVFLYGANTKAPFAAKTDRFPTKDTQKAVPHLIEPLHDLMRRVADARAPFLALAVAERTVILHQFARRFSDLYATAKQRRGWLDFDDLIQKARQLLSDDRVAAWVLYRLDGGIDHILVDEAQDTSPAQWDVIRRLAEEFSSGEGARADVTRTIFVVGDKKQSIYSFQGADPREFDRMQREFGSKLSESGQVLRDSTLDHSFRSSPAILRLVDEVFRGAGSAGFDGGQHIAFNTDLPGRVDLWPLVPKPEKEPDQDWFDPLDRRSPEHQYRILARQIAGQIKTMIDDKVRIPDAKGARPAQPRDFLILVQRRGGIFPDIIRACKEAGLPIAGADRLKVGAEIAVRDLGALLSFLATPEDSLSLATALRSPLFGWSEQDLFTLAHHREDEFLWSDLRKKRDVHPETVSVLFDLRDNIDFLRPYDLIERMLTRHGGRKRLLARLGSEAEDGINALLSQALAYERASVPSLTGFLAWMETDELEVKRQIDSASNQIRVMTVHGSKGLESPIVILPECGKRDVVIRDEVIAVKGVPVWKMPSASQPDQMAERIDEMKTAQREESLRLLYVALTRAEKWLIVAASGELHKDGDDWHQRVEAGMRASGAFDLDTPVGPGLRMEHGSWDFTEDMPEPPHLSEPAPLPDHFSAPAPALPTQTQTLSPSDLGGVKALPGDGLDEATAKAYGTWVHHLLETGGVQTSKPPPELTDVLQDEGQREAEAILRDTHLAEIFAATTLAEVAITAPFGKDRLHGTIDRLIVTPDHVHIVDFKSNRVVPDAPADCPDGVLRQMGAYAHAIAQVYPGRAQTLSILWTRTGILMSLPHDIVMSALARTPYLDDDKADT